MRPLFRGRIRAVDADERRNAFDRRVLQDRVTSSCCRSAIAGNEMDCGASEMP